LKNGGTVDFIPMSEALFAWSKKMDFRKQLKKLMISMKG